MNRIARDEEPIAALASGTAPSAIAVIRISGTGCHEILHRHVKGSKLAQRTLTLTSFKNAVSGDVIDNVLICFFKAPHSYTGQDAIEIFCHGGPYIISQILASLRLSGCREAEPGEFTKRAFLNHKLDLTAAEGIRELIEANSHQQWLAATQLVEGRLRRRVEALRESLLEALALLEARIDFPEEGDVSGINVDDVKRRVTEIDRDIKRLIATYTDGRVATQGMRTAFLGPPNAGKSTLLNTLIEKDRAIVTPHPGTTRDYLEEPCLIRGRLLRLFDMAGVRENPDDIEKIGVSNAMKLAGEAELVLVVVGADSSEEQWKHTVQLAEKTCPTNHLMVLNKVDLGRPEWLTPARQAQDGWIELSCKTGQGIDTLKDYLVGRVDNHVKTIHEDCFITSLRHLEALREAEIYLKEFFEAAAAGRYDECLAFELQQTTRALASVLGEIKTEQVLDKIFGSFCIGK